MNVSGLFTKVRRLADENSPVILTGMAVSGACLSAYFAAKGAFKAHETIVTHPEVSAVDFDGEVRGRELNTQEKFLLTYKFYIPAVATLAGTSACMILATKIGLDRTAAMAGALVVSERTYDQYKDKVKETLGENKHTKIVDAVATDAVLATPTPPGLVINEGKQLCFDMWSGRYFESTIEDLKQAVNQVNHELIYGAHASLNQFYLRLGLGPIQQGEDIGWNNKHLVELDYTAVLKDNKIPCVGVTFDREPRPRFREEASSND